MRAYVFVRYHSGDGAGHVGWGFDWDERYTNVGSVENHSGHVISTAQQMGFWTTFTADAAAPMLDHRYDEMKMFDVPEPDPVTAYRVVRWIETMPYRAIARNCEDDCYDVLRAYGVKDLEAPFFNWLPKWWFSRLPGRAVTLAASHPEESKDPGPLEGQTALAVDPLRPEWRKPWSSAFQKFKLAQLLRRAPKDA